MKYKMTNINVEVETKHADLISLAGMAYLQTPKHMSNDYKPRYEDVVLHNNKLAVVSEVKFPYALIHYVKCESGKWESLNDTNVARADELTRVDETQIDDTISLGTASLYRTLGAQTINYPEYVDQTTEEDHIVKRFWG